MKNRGSTQGTSTQNLKQIRAAVPEKKSKNQKCRRRTQGDRYSHTHSLSVTKNCSIKPNIGQRNLILRIQKLDSLETYQTKCECYGQF